MLLTEEEAKQRWCPHARDMMSGGGNRTAYGGDGVSVDPNFAREMAALHPCIASECMAWRVPSFHNPEGHGYCGLAGEPR